MGGVIQRKIVQNCLWIPIPKSHILILFLTLCIYFLKLYHGGTYSIGLLEAKNEEKLKKIVYPLTRSKINSTILGANFFSFFRILFIAIVL